MATNKPISEFQTAGDPDYLFGFELPGKGRNQPNMRRCKTAAALLADARYSYTAGDNRIQLATGDILEAGGARYEVQASGASDQDLTTAGGVKLKVRAARGAISLEDLGAPNDSTTDIANLIDIAMAIDADIIFPRRFAISRTILFKGTARRFIFPNSSVSLLAGGTFADVLTYGSGANTGYDVVLSIGNATEGAKRCSFEGALTLGSAANGSGATNLVLWSASHLGNANTNAFPLRTYLSASGFVYAYFGQNTTVAVAGSFTGSTIGYVETGPGVGAFSLAVNQDDIKFEVVRDRGRSVVNTSLRVGEYYMIGSDATKSTDGIVMGAFATLEVDHHFIEGAFNRPVLMNGADGQYIAGVRVSSNFDSASGNVVTASTDDVHVRITEEPQSRQGGHTSYVRRNPSVGARGLFEFFLTTAQGESDFKTPMVYTGANASDDITIVHDTRRTYRGRWNGTDLRYRQIDPVALTLHDETGTISGYVQPRGEAAVAVTNAGRYALYGRNADLISLESASAVQVYLYGSLGSYGPMEVTLVAGSTGNVQIVTDGTGPVNFDRGATAFTLLSGRRNTLTLRWSPTAAAWYEVARSERSVLDTATAAQIASVSAGANTTGKRLGRMVWDTTNNRSMVASGSATTDPWYVIDGSASVTPT